MSISIKKAVHRVKAFVKARKITSAVIALVLIFVGYYGVSALRGTSSEIRYVLGTVARRTIVSSVTGTGQVSATSQVQLKTKASGDVVYIGVQNGQEVKAGTFLLQLDSRDAQKAVRDAEANLESAKISYQKLIEPADTLSLIQAEDALSQANASLAKAYDDGFNAVSNAFLDLPTVMAGLFDIISGTKTGQSGQDNLSAYADSIGNFEQNATKLRDTTRERYLKARAAYDKTFLDYRAASRLSEKPVIEALVSEAYDTTKTVAEAVKATNDFLSIVKDRLTEHSQTFPSTLAPHLSSLSTYIGQTNTHLLALLGIKDTMTNSKYSISEKTESLAKLKAGAEALDISASELTMRQRENALLDAKEHLADYVVRAPFDGTVASLSVKKTDSVGSGTAVGTFITKQKVAEISLNEVDVANLSLGQKATLTFDAVSGVSISGTVIEQDTVGTVSQGVVTYTVKIGFNAPEPKIKPGMSVTATIATDTKTDVLAVPQSAVKSQGRQRYVEVVDESIIPPSKGGAPILIGAGGVTPSASADLSTSLYREDTAPRVSVAQGIVLSSPPKRRIVETGISNDALVEILSGLEEGEHVVIRTVSSPAAAPVQAQAPTIFGAAGGNRGSGGGNRGGGGGNPVRFQR